MPPIRNEVFRSGEPWLDTDGTSIQAHGGGALFIEVAHSWHGANKDAVTTERNNTGWSRATTGICTRWAPVASCARRCCMSGPRGRTRNPRRFPPRKMSSPKKDRCSAGNNLEKNHGTL